MNMRTGATVGLMIGMVALSGCATDTVSTKADNGGSGTKAAKIGQPITIKGNESGAQIQVVATKAGPTRSTDQFSAPKKRDIFYAVQFRIHNTGTAAYSDSPSNGAKLIDSQGQQYDASIMAQSISAGPLFPSSTKITPGGRALGYLVFEVPKKAKIKAVQFSEDSGFGATAQWNIR